LLPSQRSAGTLVDTACRLLEPASGHVLAAQPRGVAMATQPCCIDQQPFGEQVFALVHRGEQQLEARCPASRSRPSPVPGAARGAGKLVLLGESGVFSSPSPIWPHLPRSQAERSSPGRAETRGLARGSGARSAPAAHKSATRATGRGGGPNQISTLQGRARARSSDRQAMGTHCAGNLASS
jgi:hypothetical protein